LIAALLHGNTIPEAAQASGLSERTVSRRLADPSFQAALREARQRALSRAINVVVEGATGAAVQLRWLAGHATQEHVKLAAARAVLEYSFRGLEALDLVDEVAALRAEVAGLVAERGGPRAVSS
jgi:hypothetical protein